MSTYRYRRSQNTLYSLNCQTARKEEGRGEEGGEGEEKEKEKNSDDDETAGIQCRKEKKEEKRWGKLESR